MGGTQLVPGGQYQLEPGSAAWGDQFLEPKIPLPHVYDRSLSNPYPDRLGNFSS